MVNLRCSKCGSDSGFIIETQAGQTLDVSGHLALDRIKASVLVTCTYCNRRWDHAPVSLKGPEFKLGRQNPKRILQ